MSHHGSLRNSLCFQSGGELYNEFDNLYRSLFKSHTAHVNVVRVLTKSRQGLEYDEIAKLTGKSSGGGLSDILKELSAADFILAYKTYVQAKLVTKYRLTDQCINIFEIKFYDDEFVIDKEYASQLRRKKRVYLEQSKTRKAVFMILITTYGAKENQYFLELFDKQLTLKDLFE